MAECKTHLQDDALERRQGRRANRVVAISHRLFRRGRQRRVSDWSLSTTKNMSHSGLLFLSNAHYRKGDILDLHVVMSGVITIFTGKAKVMRVVEHGTTSFDIGVQFINIKPPSRSARYHLN